MCLPPVVQPARVVLGVHLGNKGPSPTWSWGSWHPPMTHSTPLCLAPPAPLPPQSHSGSLSPHQAHQGPLRLHPALGTKCLRHVGACGGGGRAVGAGWSWDPHPLSSPPRRGTWPKVNGGVEPLQGPAAELLCPRAVGGEEQHLAPQQRPKRAQQVPQVPVVAGVVAPVFVLHLQAGQGPAPSVHMAGLQPGPTAHWDKHPAPPFPPDTVRCCDRPQVGPENDLPAPA